MFRSIARLGWGIMVALTTALMPLTARAVTYTAADTVDLNPATLLGTGSFSDATAISGSQQVGYGGGGNTGGNFHALLWTGTAASAVDLNPAALLGSSSYSVSNATNGSQQVGYGGGGNAGGSNPHALLWTGTAASAVDLNPAALLGTGSFSEATAISGSQQVGYGGGGNTGGGGNNHALLWTGTAASAVDLNPATLLGTGSFSDATAISGSQQVGYGYGGNTGGNNHALLWTGTAASAVDLNPATLLGTGSFSDATAISGSQQVGAGGGGNTGSNNHALLWTGTAASAVDLNPATLLGTGSFSEATAISGSQQVGFGFGSATGYVNHALLWTGTAGSAIDLHILLPSSSSFYSSYATAIDPYGNIVGNASNGSSSHAVEWLAGDLYNLAGTGAWATGSNWTAGTPAASNDVLLLQQDSSNRTISYSSSATSTPLGNITIDATGSGTMAVSQTGGTLNSTNETIGFIGNGAYSQSGGTHLVTSAMTLAVQAGSQGTYTLSGSGSLHAGSILLNSGGTFNQTGGTLYAGTFTQAGGTFTGTLQNQGNFIYQSGQFNGRLLNQGTVSLGPNFTAGNGVENDASMILSAGQTLTVNGSGFDNLGTLTLSGGTIAGLFTNDYGGTMSVQAGNSTLNYSAGYNYGTLTVSGVLTLASNAVYNYGLINLNSGGVIRQNGVNNLGTMTFSGGAVTATTNNNGGGIIQGGGSISGSLSNNTGGVIDANSPTTPLEFASFQGNFAGASITVAAVSSLYIQNPWSNSGIVTLQGAGAVLGGATITNTGTIQGAGMVSAPVINSTGIIRASGGELDLMGAKYTGLPPVNSTSNGAGAQIQASTGNTVMYVQGLVTNAGTITLSGGTFDNNNQLLSNTNTGFINGYGTLRTGGLTSTGKLNVGEGNLDVFGNVINNGTIGVQGGRSIYFYGNVSGSGSYTGVGTATFLAAVSPGNSPATVSFAGNVDLTSATTLNIELGGVTPGTQYDQLHVAGSLALGGALNVVLDTGFQPVLGNSFDILDWASGQLTGSFSSVQLPKLNGAEAWSTSQLYTTGVLSVVPTYLPGDVNRDGVVNVTDISALMIALANVSKYRSDNSLTDPVLFKDVADVNGDTRVDNLDVQALISLVANNAALGIGGALPGGAGAQQVAAVPEPASILLFGIGALAIALCCRCGSTSLK